MQRCLEFHKTMLVECGAHLLHQWSCIAFVLPDVALLMMNAFTLWLLC